MPADTTPAVAPAIIADQNSAQALSNIKATLWTAFAGTVLVAGAHFVMVAFPIVAQAAAGVLPPWLGPWLTPMVMAGMTGVTAYFKHLAAAHHLDAVEAAFGAEADPMSRFYVGADKKPAN